MKFRAKLGVCIMMGPTFLSAIFPIVKATYLWLLFGAEDICRANRSALKMYKLTSVSL